jgi:hypothetical protein
MLFDIKEISGLKKLGIVSKKQKRINKNKEKLKITSGRNSKLLPKMNSSTAKHKKNTAVFFKKAPLGIN